MAAAAVLVAAALSAGGARAAAAAGQSSSCVTCHTDVARLQEEAKGIPLPAASPLQAGKG
jgi:cytochrome c553